MTKLAREATTLAIVATDATLTQAQLTRLAIAAHDGMARAIVPSHTQFDGDIVFAVSTGAGPAPPPLDMVALGPCRRHLPVPRDCARGLSGQPARAHDASPLARRCIRPLD